MRRRFANRPIDQSAGFSEAVADIVRCAAADWQEHAAVVVTDVREAAAAVGQQPGGEAEPSYGGLEGAARPGRR